MSQNTKSVRTLESLSNFERWVVVGDPVVVGRTYRVPCRFLNLPCGCERSENEAKMHASGVRQGMNPSDAAPWRLKATSDGLKHKNCSKVLYTVEQLRELGAGVEKKKSRRIFRPEKA